MNLATLLVALIATSAADTSGDPVLLDFQATWCAPCQQMRPEVEKLVKRGYPVKQVDIDRSPDLSDRYNVTAVPTFIVVDSKGKELARTKGVLPAAQLASFYNETKLKAAASAPVEEAQDRADLDSLPDEADSASPVVNPRPWETVVRIKMHLSDREWGFGSGTIIYSSAEESIILTCAHIFRLKGQQQPTPRNFRVPITVDLFGGQLVQRQPAQLACTQQDLPGEAIDYDFTNDVGLIRIKPGRKLPASRVVPVTWKPKKGMNMVTVGVLARQRRHRLEHHHPRLPRRHEQHDDEGVVRNHQVCPPAQGGPVRRWPVHTGRLCRGGSATSLTPTSTSDSMPSPRRSIACSTATS